MRFVALDVGKSKSAMCEVLADGTKVHATLRKHQDFVDKVGPDTEHAIIAFEACREGWAIFDQLADWGHDPGMLDTTRVRRLGIGHHGRKTDKIDAEVIAAALKRGDVPEAHVLSPARRELRHALSVRKTLVATRAGLIVQLRGLTQASGVKLSSCSADAFINVVRFFPMPKDLAQMLEPLIQVLVATQAAIAEAHEKIITLIKRVLRYSPVARSLGPNTSTPSKDEDPIYNIATIPGVSLIIAAAFVSVIDEAGRFKRASHVASYLGLCPSEFSSGSKRKLGAITKAGNKYVRALLVQAAWCVLRGSPEDPITAWGTELAKRRGNRIAAVAVARRLARLMWALWRDNSVYEPDKLGNRAALGLEASAKDLERRATKLRKAKTSIDKTMRAYRRAAERATTT